MRRWTRTCLFVAAFGALGAAPAPGAVVEVGGGTTEIALAQADAVSFAISADELAPTTMPPPAGAFHEERGRNFNLVDGTLWLQFTVAASPSLGVNETF